MNSTLYTAFFISLNIHCKMAMFSSKMDKSMGQVNSFEIGNQTYRSIHPIFSKIKYSRYVQEPHLKMLFILLLIKLNNGALIVDP
jgi:hypothetical protein